MYQTVILHGLFYPDPFLIFGNRRFIVAIKPDGTFQGYFDLGLEANVIAVDVDCRYRYGDLIWEFLVC